MILLIGWMAMRNAMYFMQIILKKGFSIRSLFKDFGQKMWMTIGLGGLFFALYSGLIFYGSHILDSQMRRKIFFLAYKHPSDFIYLGLLLFACVSLCIYLARIIIKYLYNSRSK